MRPFHEKLARIGLKASEEYGFALAGGYALSANGYGNRPSSDVDLFTNEFDPARFNEAVTRVQAALEAEGLQVASRTVADLFADLDVIDLAAGQRSDFQLGANYREFPTARIEIGPVLDIRDAVAGKMSALWSRGEVRDYIDIDTVLASGNFTPSEILSLADEQETLPMDRAILAERFRQVAAIPLSRFVPYGVTDERRTQIITRFAAWADQITPDTPPATHAATVWRAPDVHTPRTPGTTHRPHL